MKLALFSTFGMSLEKWEKGGMLSREVKLYKELSKHFDEIYFITYGDDNEIKYIDHLPSNINLLINKKKLNSLLYSIMIPIEYSRRLNEVDIYKTNQMLGSWVAVIAKVIYRKKLVIRQGYQLSLFYKKRKRNFVKILAIIIEFMAYKMADKIIITSQEDEQYIIKKYKIKKENIEVITNYVDTNTFKPSNIKKIIKRIIFIGRLSEQKNILSLMDAVKDLDVNLVIIGDGPLKDVIIKKIKNEKIMNIELCGIIPNEKLPEELNKSEIFVLPSFHEGMPKTLLEAMSCGLPCLGTTVEGIREVINQGENGWLVGTDAESIKKGLLTLIEDEKLREKLGENARKSIEEKFSLEKVVEMEMRIYKSLVEM